MGCDWQLYLCKGEKTELVASIWRSCSRNFQDVWKEFDFDYDVLHGHSGKVVCHYLNEVIARMLEAGVETMTDRQRDVYEQMNPDFWWGLRESEETRKRIVLYQLMMYRRRAEENYQAYWFGDQACYMGPYTIDGIDIEGKEHM